MDLPKGKVKVPVLLVHHVEDPCDGTPYKKLDEVKAFYSASVPQVSVISVTGGDSDRGDKPYGCSGGYHAFNGIRKPVMDGIVQWLDGDTRSYYISE